MNLYRISQTKNDGYDTYSDAVVVADDARGASQTHPDGNRHWDAEKNGWYRPGPYDERRYGDHTWTTPDNVVVELLGTANPIFLGMNEGQSSIICCSFHAG